MELKERLLGQVLGTIHLADMAHEETYELRSEQVIDLTECAVVPIGIAVHRHVEREPCAVERLHPCSASSRGTATSLYEPSTIAGNTANGPPGWVCLASDLLEDQAAMATEAERIRDAARRPCLRVREGAADAAARTRDLGDGSRAITTRLRTIGAPVSEKS